MSLMSEFIFFSEFDLSSSPPVTCFSTVNRNPYDWNQLNPLFASAGPLFLLVIV